MLKLRLLSLLLFCSLTACFSVNAQMNQQYAASVGMEWSGPFKKNHFLAQDGVVAWQKITHNHWETISVDSFKIAIIRDTGSVFFHKNIGNRFHTDVSKFFKGMMVGDIVLIFDIYAKNLSIDCIFIQPLQYVIE